MVSTVLAVRQCNMTLLTWNPIFTIGQYFEPRGIFVSIYIWQETDSLIRRQEIVWYDVITDAAVTTVCGGEWVRPLHTMHSAPQFDFQVASIGLFVGKNNQWRTPSRRHEIRKHGAATKQTLVQLLPIWQQWIERPKRFWCRIIWYIHGCDCGGHCYREELQPAKRRWPATWQILSKQPMI